MWWHSGEGRVIPVRVSWLREERGPDGQYVETGRGEPVAGVWREQDAIHIVSYEERTVEAEGSQPVRTVLRLEPLRAALIRYGDVRGSHTFEAGRTHASVMYVGRLPLRTEITTKRLVVHVTPQGGQLQVEYDLLLGDGDIGERQSVRVTLWFAAADGQTALREDRPC